MSQSRRTTSAVALDELKRRRDLESLRKYLVSEQCFPATKDPLTSVITMEELKKLARIWKLNEQRNFWKTHSERNEMVAALLEHSEQNKNFIASNSKNLTKVPSVVAPMPPVELKPSVQSNRSFGKNFRDYCGLKYFNRENNPTELVISSRFFDFPDPVTNVDHVVDNWRSEDFNMRDEHATATNSTTNRSQSLTTASPGRYTIAMGAAKNKVKVMKHRNLAAHLMNYSANVDISKANLTLKSVQTFINVAETDDFKTVSNCMIAISNIAGNENVRALLFELNALHKLTNFLQYTKGQSAQWAAALLFYYFSCDKESEDRVYNACSAFAQANGASDDLDTRLLALYTMNNLMPCIDRQRVVEIAMRIINGLFDLKSNIFDKNLTSTCLLVLQNMSCFSNAHHTLLALNILEFLTYFSEIAAKNKNYEVGMNVVKILNSFLFLPEQAANLLNAQYIEVLIILLSMDHEGLLIQSMKAATTISSITSLRSIIRTTALTSTVTQMVSKRQLTNNLSKDVCKYISNITLTQSAEQLEKLVEDKVPEAIFLLLRNSNVSAALKSTVVKGLQNILSSKANCIKLAESCFEPLIRMLRDTHDIGAAYALYNISCIPECRTALVENKIHFKMLELLAGVKDLVNVKSAYLQILVQMSSSNICVIEMLNVDLVSKLESQLKKGHNSDVWKDISTMLLAVVAFAAKDLSEKDQASIVHILGIICVKGVEDEIVENCANVLKYVSVRYGVFEELNPVVRTMLAISDSEEVVESLSTVLYNMTCIQRNVMLMLQDEQYVNIMIRIMRSGKVEVQENIAQAMRTLCSIDKCTQILLKNDILSDLIVIALLRTSSEEIKVVCSEAFYNMLCHEGTRQKLLKGDLWWAVMRLCRTDSTQVRQICARTLFDLSCDASNVAPLRVHHVLSFVKDVSTSGNDVFLTQCLHSVHNLIKQFATDGNDVIATHEIIACVRIGADALCRCTNIDSIKDALILLLKCSQHDLSIGTDAEFINIDIVNALDTTKHLWKDNNDCKLYISRLLWELSKSSYFTKSATLVDLDPIFCALHSPDTPEVIDNIAAVFMQFMIRERVVPQQFIGLAIWEHLLNEVLGQGSTQSTFSQSSSSVKTDQGESSAGSPAAKRDWKARGTLYRGESLSYGEARELMKGQATSGMTFATKGCVISILAYSIKEHLASTKVKITKSLIKGMLTNELLDHPMTRVNLLHIVQSLSSSPALTNFMIDTNVFQLLSRYLVNSIGTNKQDKAQEFCATFIHNLSLHQALLTKLISTSDGSIDALISEILEVPNPAVLLDLTVFFYNVSAVLVNNDASLNPQYVLKIINKILAADPVKENSTVADINKYTISTILNTYTFDSGVDPSFVQSMFTYMQNNPSSITPEYMESVRFKTASDTTVVLLPDFIKSILSIPVPLRSTSPDKNKWQPTYNTECRCNQNIILKFTQAVPVINDKLEGSDTYSSPSFSKIVKQFDRVRERMASADNVALLEGDEDEEDEDQLTQTAEDVDQLTMQDRNSPSLKGKSVGMSLEEVQDALNNSNNVDVLESAAGRTEGMEWGNESNSGRNSNNTSQKLSPTRPTNQSNSSDRRSPTPRVELPNIVNVSVGNQQTRGDDDYSQSFDDLSSGANNGN